MNKIVNKFLLMGDKSMPKSHLRQQRFILFTMVVDSLLNIVKGLKNLKKQAI